MKHFAGFSAGWRNGFTNSLHLVSWGKKSIRISSYEFEQYSRPRSCSCTKNIFGIRIAQKGERGKMFHAQSLQGDLMRLHVSLFPIAAALTGLIGCNSQDARVTSASDDLDEDRYHEKSFSWGESSGGLPKASALAGIAGKQTAFATQEELVAAVKALDEKLKDHAFTDSLWKPVDYACDELDLAVWNEYGTVRLGDSVVFDEGMLKSRCRLSEGIDQESETHDQTLEKKSISMRHHQEVVDRQYPYKMIGRVWDNYDLWAYKSSGGETQFEKRRSRFGVTAWYDTDATRIGVRVYLFDCGDRDGLRYCYHGDTKMSWYKNDDYVSYRDFAVGKIVIHSDRLPEIHPAKLFGSDFALSMHSVDHAGLQFRAQSISNPNVKAEFEFVDPEFVTW